MNRRTTAATVLLVALALPLSACGSGGGKAGDNGSSNDSGQQAAASAAKGVQVTGDFGKKPTVKIKAPLKVKKTTAFVTIPGNGKTLRKGMSYRIELTLADAQSGKTVVSTYGQGQQPLAGTAGQGTNLFPAVENALIGKKAGSRVVVEATAQDTYGARGNPQLGIKAGDPLVLVADLESASTPLTHPQGTHLKHPANAPKLVTKKGVPTGFDFGSLHKPGKLEVFTLVKGNGKKITSGSSATVNYLGSVWGSKKVFDQSYSRHQTATFPIGVGGVIKGWDKGLQGVTVGSRVLIVCPPKDAYGAQGRPPTIPKNATLAFVIDVLGAG